MQAWLKETAEIGDFEVKDLVPSLSEDTVASLVLKHRAATSPLDACKESLVWLFSQDGAVRASKRNPEILDLYFKKMSHKSFPELYAYC